MRWLINIPIRRKLMLITILASAIALLLAGSIIVAYDSISYRTQKLQEGAVRAETLAANVSASLVFNDPKAAQEYLNALRASSDTATAAIYAANGSLFNSYLRAGTQASLPARAENKQVRLEDSSLVVFWPVTEGLQQVGTVYLRIDTEPLVARIARYGGIILLVMIGSLLITLPIAMRMHAVIANPIREMTEAARRIAAGEIVVSPIGEVRTDEIGFLEEKFRQMAESLQEKVAIGRQIALGDLALRITPQSDQDALGNAFVAMVRNLQEKAEVANRIATGDLTVQVKLQSERDVLGKAFDTMVLNLRLMNRELGEGVDVLASSASAILAGTTQVATSATQAASAIEETASTVREVKQTAQLSSQKAKNVADAAQKAAQVAQAGRESVEEVVQGMWRIQAQMDAIAASIMQLSEQNQAISEIIATVKDLAEQSNVLAVNAAIEAAKAGEYGKGFSVVAQEMRSLAQQSKQATAQVRVILGDIQNATSAAVLATEQGSKVVESGVKQSTEAGESIQLLADSVVTAAQAAIQIAASSQQQMVGMDQLAMAMENIKLSTMQNMESTKNAEAAANSLHKLGLKLKALVGRNKVQ